MRARVMHVEWVEDEAVVLDPETGLVHYLNPSAALAYALILEHGPSDGIEELRNVSDGDSDAVEELVTLLMERGLLVDD